MTGPVVCPCGALLSLEPVDPDVARVLREAHETVSPHCAHALDRILRDVLGPRKVR